MSNATATMPYDSPIGRLVLESDGDVLIGIWLPHERRHGRRDVDDVPPVLKEAATQLDEYFAGERRTFDVAMELDGTEFQREVWSELIEDPLRKDHQLRRTGPASGSAERPARRGSGERTQSDADHRAVSPGGRQQRDRRLRGRSRGQARTPRRRGRHGLTPRARVCVGSACDADHSGQYRAGSIDSFVRRCRGLSRHPHYAARVTMCER